MNAGRYVVIHPRALEVFRRRAGKSVAQVLIDAGIDAPGFRERIRGEGFGLSDVARLAQALDTTPRELTTTSTVLAAAERLRRPRVAP